MAYRRPTIDEIVDRETRCLMDRGAPLFLTKKDIHDDFGFNEKDISRIMAAKTPIISGRFTLADVLYAVHGV